MDDNQYITQVLSNFAVPVLPNHLQRIGASTVEWWEAEPGRAVIMAYGGTCDDRTLAEQVVKAELGALGYVRASYAPWVGDLRKTADWTDIMAKAKRLIQSGNVTVLRNGYNNIVGHVIGDHGEYNTEIGRDDPNSRTITTWQCECPWDQYAWQRTRKWKKYEGRPCAHVMALYWKSLATPLDEDLSPEQAQSLGTGQKLPGSPSNPSGVPTPPPTPTPAAGGPAAPPGMPPGAGPDFGAAQAPMAPPADPSVLPPPPMDQMQMMQPPQPGMTPGGMPSPPGSMSIPGAKPQTPFNPIQYPGGTYSAQHSIPPENLELVPTPPPNTYYHVSLPSARESIQQYGLDDSRAMESPWANIDDYDEGTYLWDNLASARQYGHDIGRPVHIWQVNGDGLNLAPDETGTEKVHNAWHTPDPIESNRLSWLGEYDPNSHTSAVQFQPDQTIILKNDAYGLTEGRRGAVDAGQYRNVPAGSHGSVLAQDETTGWVEAIFPLEGGPMTSYHVRCFLEPSDLKPSRQPPPGPFIQRRR